MPRGIPVDLTGARFGSWKVLYRVDGLRNGHVMWVCICDCGTSGAVATTHLTNGRSQGCRSCGAYRAHARRKASGN